ncbi:hypothetical protein MPTK1_6g17150 [Marchantia polymorpha subsp. ruderalis]
MLSRSFLRMTTPTSSTFSSAGRWSQGFMAMAAVGATNVGSIELKFEPELKTNIPKVGLSWATINSRTYMDKMVLM